MVWPLQIWTKNLTLCCCHWLILTLLSFSVTSECRLKNGNKIFRQRGTFTVKETPLISVIMTPAQTLVRCGNIKTLTFQCTVQSPYTVMFVDPGSTAGN